MPRLQQDQGWAWVVVVASFTAHMLIYAVLYGIGAFNIVFLEEFQESSAATAWIGSINTGVMMFACFLASILVNRYGCRTVTILGGFLTSAGFVASMFATSIYYLYISFGVIAGFGSGLVYIPSVMAVTMYFETKRIFAVGLAVSGAGMGVLLFPLLFRIIVDEYGWRQSMLICGAIMLNFCVCGMVYFPTNTDGDAHIVKKSKILRMSMLRKEKFTKLCLNNLLFFLGVTSLYLHIPAYAKSFGNSDDSASLLISIMGSTNFVGRIAFGALGNHPKISCVLLYNTSFLVIGISTFLFPLYKNYNFMAVFCASLGFLTAAGGSMLPTIVLEFVGMSRMANAYGFLILYEAVGALLGAPVAGWIYDVKQAYSPAFFFAAATITLSGLVMLIPPLTDKLGLGKQRPSIERGWSLKKMPLPTSKGPKDIIVAYNFLIENKKELEALAPVSHV